MSKLLKRTPLSRIRISRGTHCRSATKHPFQQAPTHVVAFLRHGESTWNAANLFTGWYDAPLTTKGVTEAQKAAKILEKEAMCFDTVFTSRLRRAQETVHVMFNFCSGKKGNIEIVEDHRLNERHYGNLTGFNKDRLMEMFGDKQVSLWRRGFDSIPPPMARDHPFFDEIKNNFPDIDVPKSESLKMTLKRTVDFWRSTIVPEIKTGRRVLVVAHNNTLRTIVKYLDDISDEEIMDVRFETGLPFTYTLDMYMKPLRHKRLQYLQLGGSTQQCTKM